ncbi:hypothetical protein [Halomarina oriensis]|uniref:Uncharacterized protein n=1 Tax=Halomarina oriensis TaxID=671145 RepID=A0A6B0GL31_9EURY|nr:hypothetical protein [Halomarina oriensis]MWG35636.1 hypothetical protein [Halomarina oriensis]
MTRLPDPMDGISRRRLLRNTALLGTATMLGVGTAASQTSYSFPSTNANNRANGFPYVELVEDGNCEVTLRFVNGTNSLAYFEYRIDGVTPAAATSPHPVVTGSVIYPGVSVDGRGDPAPVVATETLAAAELVEVRLALGGERDWDFDWTPFAVDCDAETKADCKNGGWETFGFRNQGQCLRYVNTGKDSRPE